MHCHGLSQPWCTSVVYSNKKLGQHFISDSNIHKKIVRSAGPLGDFNVLEIGPGYGGLTRAILDAQPRNFVALEKDLSFADHYTEHFAQRGDSFVFGDALTTDERSLLQRPAKIISNLPFNISSQLIFKWLEYVDFFASITIMVQKEFALRLNATHSNKAYGRLSVLVQSVCDVRYEFTVNPQCFVPPPKVDSAVISIMPLAQARFPYCKKQLFDFTKFAFNHRRKQLYGTLRTYLGEQSATKAETILEMAGIDAKDRPDGISVEQHCKLSVALDQLVF